MKIILCVQCETELVKRKDARCPRCAKERELKRECDRQRKKRATDPDWVEKVREQKRNWQRKKRATDPDYSIRVRERKAGWPEGRFSQLWKEQKGRCAACGKKMKKTGWSTDSSTCDHDHKTGQPRDLICSVCNRAVGYVEKHPQALAYVEKWKA